MAEKKVSLRETRDIRTLTRENGSSNLFWQALGEFYLLLKLLSYLLSFSTGLIFFATNYYLS